MDTQCTRPWAPTERSTLATVRLVNDHHLRIVDSETINTQSCLPPPAERNRALARFDMTLRDIHKKLLDVAQPGCGLDHGL
jgi:hypothetical protein